MKVYTGSIQNCNNENSISVYKLIDSCGNTTIPSQDMMNSEDYLEIVRSFVGQYYNSVLRAINPSEVFIQLSEGSILVSPEEPEEFSCRQLIAAWLELYYGLEICEVTILENGKMKTLPRNVYYQMCKSILEEMIKEDIDMNGYTSIAAAYAYERAKKVAQNEALNDMGISEIVYVRMAEALEKKLGSGNQKK